MVVKANCEDDTPDDNDNLHIYEVSQIPSCSEGKLMDTF
jgi:hypothetical protein